MKDTFLWFQIPWTKLCGQCYDGTMARAKAGVAAKIEELEPRAVFVHCYGRVYYDFDKAELESELLILHKLYKSAIGSEAPSVDNINKALLTLSIMNSKW